MLHPRRQVGCLADGRIVHAQVAADASHDHFTRVEAHTDLHIEALPTKLVGVPADGLLHPQRGVACPHRVILVGERGAEERHDPVTHHLVHRPLVAVDRLHQPLDDGIEELPRLLGIAIGEQLHGALHVGEEDRDLLALSLERGLRGEDFLGEVPGRVGLRRVELGGWRDRTQQVYPAAAELFATLVRETAGEAGARQPSAALPSRSGGSRDSLSGSAGTSWGRRGGPRVGLGNRTVKGTHVPAMRIPNGR